MRAYWLLRWFCWEFLAIQIRGNLSTALVGISRVVAWLTICGVLHLTLSGGVAHDVAAAGLQWSLGIALALMLGNLARECTVSIAARLSVSLGREFRRVGATIDGKTYDETFRTDGTWMRCVVGPDTTVCEWTDTYGACNKVVTRPVRARPPR